MKEFYRSTVDRLFNKLLKYQDFRETFPPFGRSVRILSWIDYTTND